MDSGADIRHPDLEGRIAAQRDFVSSRPIAEDDFAGHSTHIAGIVARGTEDLEDVAGCSAWCRIFIAKVTDSANGEGEGVAIAESLRWSVDKGVGVINVSLAGPDSENLRSAVDYAANKGVLIVAAAGNQGMSEPAYPAAYPNVLAVAATDNSDQLLCDSNYGSWVDLAALGDKIFSAAPGGGYCFQSGTSQASARVAALSASLLALGYGIQEVRSRMRGRPWVPEHLVSATGEPN